MARDQEYTQFGIGIETANDLPTHKLNGQVSAIQMPIQTHDNKEYISDDDYITHI